VLELDATPRFVRKHEQHHPVVLSRVNNSAREALASADSRGLFRAFLPLVHLFVHGNPEEALTNVLASVVASVATTDRERERERKPRVGVLCVCVCGGRLFF